MPTSDTIYQTLVGQYNQLPWYKKVGFWLSSPRLAWGLFGYKQTPSENRIKELIQWAKASWFLKTKFEQTICDIIFPSKSSSRPKFEELTVSLVQEPQEASSQKKHKTLLRGEVYPALQHVADYLEPEERAAYKALSSQTHSVCYDPAKKSFKVTSNLLLAVAYGMESKESNVPVKASNAGNLFKSHLYAKDLLQQFPEYLLKRSDVTDWAGRTFKNITAFEYALWAKDFKMLEMMLGCMPATPEGNEIRAQLFEQAKQVMAPTREGGGLTYTHTYDRPNLDASGIPDGTTTKITESHTENHFNLTPLCDAYDDYDINFDVRSNQQRAAYWMKLIGSLQRLLPVHILQRYCDPNTAFFPLPKFTSAFKRSSDFCSNNNIFKAADSSLLNSSLSSDFAILRWGISGCAVSSARVLLNWPADLQAIRRLDKVSTNEIKNIIGQLSLLQHDVEMRP